MKAPSLISRLVLLQLALAAAIMLAFAGSAVWLSARALEREESAFLSNTASLVAKNLEDEWKEDGNLTRAATETLAENSPPGVQIDILDGAGQLLISTANDRERRTHADMRETRVLLTRGATIVASMSMRSKRKAISALITAFALTAVPLFLLVLILSRGLASRALHPLSRMAEQAERTPLSGAQRPLGRDSDPAEVMALAGAFNRLISRLDEGLRVERDFAQDAAHELRTPITALSGELELALSEPSGSERQRESLRRVSNQVRQMRELVDALLLLRRADSDFGPELDEMLPLNLGDLVQDVARELIARFPERAGDLRVEAGDEVLVMGHETLIQSAIRNLLSNALQFTRPGQPVLVTVPPGAGRCVVVVEDGGPGVPVEQRERIFDPFFRSPEARAAHEGFGLGLPILRRVARVHGGDVAVGSSALGGARFELWLPPFLPGAASSVGAGS